MPRPAALLALTLALLAFGAFRPSQAGADAASGELRSSGAALAGWTASTGLLVGLAAIPIVHCGQDLACLGTAIMSVGGFVLAHPFVAAAGVHGSTVLAGDRQPYWHSLVSQLAGDTLAVGAFALAVKFAPASRRSESTGAGDEEQRLARALTFTAAALLSLAGPLVMRPLLDDRAQSPVMARMALTF